MKLNIIAVRESGISGFCTSSGILNIRKKKLGKVDPFKFSGQGR
jgi:hypothetical protein